MVKYAKTSHRKEKPRDIAGNAEEEVISTASTVEWHSDITADTSAVSNITADTSAVSDITAD